MKRGARFRFGEQSGDQSAHDGAADTEQSSEDEAQVLCTRHNGACDPPDNEADDNVPNEV